jgi:hypothetical protein
MKARNNPHTVSIASRNYVVGKTTITLLPGTRRQLLRVSKLAERLAETDAAKEAHLLSGAEIEGTLLLALVWDDPELQLETPIPDRVDTLADPEILELCASILDELETPEIRAKLPTKELFRVAAYGLLGADVPALD